MADPQENITGIARLVGRERRLSTAQTQELQQLLLAAGYTRSYNQHGFNGVLGTETLKDIVDCARDHPEVASSLSRSMKASIAEAGLKIAPPSTPPAAEGAVSGTMLGESFRTQADQVYAGAQQSPLRVSHRDNGDVAIINARYSPGASGKVALVIPSNFDPDKPAMLVPYFHGHGGSINDTLGRQKLLECAQNSGQNVVFVVPQLGERSEIRREFNDPRFVANFLEESRSALACMYLQTHLGEEAQEVREAFSDMHLVPISYSGGYKGATALINHTEVDGVVMLDSMYGGSRAFTDLSNRASSPFVTVLYGPSTAENSQEFAENAAAGTAYVSPMLGKHGSLVQNALTGVLSELSIGSDGSVGYVEAPDSQGPPPAPTAAPRSI